MVNDTSLFISFVGGTLLPLIIAFILSYAAPSYLKAIVTLIVCILWTALAMWLDNKFVGPTQGMSTNDTVKLWVENLGLVLVSAWSTFQFFWKPVGIVPSLEMTGGNLGGPKPPPTS